MVRRYRVALGVAGEAPDSVCVVETVADARCLVVPEASSVAVVTQTTLSLVESEQVIAVLRERFPGLEAPAKSDICYATTNRQEAVRRIAEVLAMHPRKLTPDMVLPGTVSR